MSETNKKKGFNFKFSSLPKYSFNILFKNRFITYFKRRTLLTFLTLGIGFKFSDEILMTLLGEKYRMKKCNEALQERFNFSGKYIKASIENFSNPKELCTITPTNIYDAQKLIEIANFFRIPIMYDVNSHQNELNSYHFKIDFSKYDKIVKFDSTRKMITLEPGVRIFNLLTFLDKFNLTIPALENYKFSTLTISDVLFNNFYSFNQGKFIDDLIHEVLIVTPKNNKILNFKQNDDLTLTGLNMKNLFLRTNSTLGIMIEVRLEAKKIKDHKYLAIQNVENKIEESLNIVQALKESKKELGLSDVCIIHKENDTDLILKIKNKHLRNCIELLNSTNIHFTQISKDEYLKHLVLSNNTHLDKEHILRKLKINLNKLTTAEFIKKAEKLAKEKGVEMQFRCSYIDNELEMIIKSKDDMKAIEDAYMYINKIHSLVLKQEGNIFGKKINFKKFFFSNEKKFIFKFYEKYLFT